MDRDERELKREVFESELRRIISEEIREEAEDEHETEMVLRQDGRYDLLNWVPTTEAEKAAAARSDIEFALKRELKFVLDARADWKQLHNDLTRKAQTRQFAETPAVQCETESR